MVTAAWAGAAPDGVFAAATADPEAVFEPPRPPAPLALEVPFEEPLPSARIVIGDPVAPAAAAAEADERPALVVFPVLLEAPLPSARTVMAAAADAPAAGVGDEPPAAGAGEGPPFVGAGPCVIPGALAPAPVGAATPAGRVAFATLADETNMKLAEPRVGAAGFGCSWSGISEMQEEMRYRYIQLQGLGRRLVQKLGQVLDLLLGRGVKLVPAVVPVAVAPEAGPEVAEEPQVGVVAEVALLEAVEAGPEEPQVVQLEEACQLVRVLVVVPYRQGAEWLQFGMFGH